MKAFITAIGLALLNLLPCYAGDNQAFIDQAGQFSEIYVLQDGVGNSLSGVGGPAMPSNPANIHGNGNVVNIQQVGSNDQLQLTMETTSMPRPIGGLVCSTCPVPVQGNSWSYVVNGNNAKAVIDVNADGKGTSVSNGMDVSQTGDYAVLNAKFKGDHNSVTVNTSGTNQTMNVNVSGSTNTQSTAVSGGGFNTVTVTQSGANGIATTNVNGTANTVTISQSDTAAHGHMVALDISGNSNTVTIAQSGLTADTNINIKSTGTNNIINAQSMAR